MNPPSSTPFPNHPYSPYIPNPNPNPNFFLPFLPHPQQPPPPLPLQPPLPPPPLPQIPLTTATINNQILDPSTTLSSLTNLFTLSHETLNSLPSIFTSKTIHPEAQDASLIPCPHNPNHLMPPESLFLHTLRCPSPILQDPSSLFDSLHYPKTLKANNSSKDLFIQSIEDSSTGELCFCLDGYFKEFSSNFFYKDCPGVVKFSDLDRAKRVFCLPRVLWVECADSVGSSEGEIKGFDKNAFKVLPSDLWAIGREIEGWADYPHAYSINVLCAILRLNVIKGSDLRRWVIANSPHYGVVIDVYMRDHVSVLFGLCLKAIRTEALRLVGCGMNVRTSSFECPATVQVLIWIASQLSVLYGEVNAKCFAICVFKQCVLQAAKEGLLFPLESNLKENLGDLDANQGDVRDFNLEGALKERTECKAGKGSDTGVSGEVVYVSQVTAAVAALHERSFLEAKIKGLWGCQLLPRYQRIAEHAYLSKRAEEERKQHPNYKAIIEHDGLLQRRPSNQDEMNKTKTKEELLAEERDYKRRRMSYRAKKQKRTTLEVMRDIIDECMEDIKQAGGIDCFEKWTEEEGTSAKPHSAADVATGVNELIKSNADNSEVENCTPSYYEKQSHIAHHIRSKTFKNAPPQDIEQLEQKHDRHHEHVQYQKRNTSQDRHSRECYSRSPERRRNHDQFYEHGSQQREWDNVEQIRTKHRGKRWSSKSTYHDSSVQNDDWKIDAKDKHRRSSHANHGSNSHSQNAFLDRYDPTESRYAHEDDL